MAFYIPVTPRVLGRAVVVTATVTVTLGAAQAFPATAHAAVLLVETAAETTRAMIAEYVVHHWLVWMAAFIGGALHLPE